MGEGGVVVVVRTEWEDDPTSWGRSSSPCARPARRLVHVLSDGRRVPYEEEPKIRVWYRLGAKGAWRSLLLAHDACTALDLKLAVVRAENLVGSDQDFDLSVNLLDSDSGPLGDTEELRADGEYDLRRVRVTVLTKSLPRMCRGEAVIAM